MLKHFIYVVYEHFEYRRKWPIFLRLLWSLPGTVFYIRVLIKVAKQLNIAVNYLLRVALPGRNMRNNLTLDITTSSRVTRRVRSGLSVL